MAKVRLAVIGNDIRISVEDTGRGIPQHELKNIFQPFYRLAQSMSVSGFGLGLPLVNRIIKLHNGVVTVNSIVAEGTTFSISLPCAGKYPE